MTTSSDGDQPAAAASAAEEWSEAFGDLDLVNDTPDTSSQPSHSSSSTDSSTTNADKLNIVEALWFLHTDEQTATQQYAGDTKTRAREILNFRVDKQQLVHLDLLARCHHKLHDLPAALSLQRQIVSLRPSISNLLLLSRWMAEEESQTDSATATDPSEKKLARAEVLMRCIEHCPVHASAWHDLALVFLALSTCDSLSSTSHSSAASCCSQHSFLRCARLTFSLVADLTNFTISTHLHPAGDVPSLSTPLYSTLLASAQQHTKDIDAQLPPLESTTARDGECVRCAGVCECWRARLHRYACLPLSSLFIAEKQAEQAGVEGSKRTEKKRGERRKGGEVDDESDDETADVGDALDL